MRAHVIETRDAGPLRFGFFAVLLASLIPAGSTGSVALGVSGALTGMLALVTMLTVPEPPATARLGRTAALIALGLLLFVVLQAARWPGNPLAAPIWSTAAATLDARSDLIPGAITGAISINPAATWAASVPLLAPFLVFLLALRLFPDDDGALSLLRFLGATGGLAALYGIWQLTFVPGTLLLVFEAPYGDSLTAVFVNRNTAGTFFGLAALILGVLVVLDHRRGRRIWHGALFTLCLTALLLARSRGALAATAIAFLLLAGPLWTLGLAGRLGGRRRLLIAASAVVAIVALTVFGGRTLLRAEVQGLEDGRFCITPGLLRAVADHWPLGSGLGTFADAFMPHRDPACGLYGYWDRAHNFYLEGLIVLGAAFPVVLFLVVSTLAAVFSAGLRTRRRLRPVAALGLAVMLLVLAHALVDFSLQIHGLAVFTASALAACCTASLGRSRQWMPSPDAARVSSLRDDAIGSATVQEGGTRTT